MRGQWVAGAVVLLCATTARAQAPEMPGMPPQFAMVGEIKQDAGMIQLIYTVTKNVFETKTISIETDGKVEERNVTVCRPVCECAYREVNLDNVRIVTAGKLKLDKAAALERLVRGKYVLTYTQGVKFDARYLEALHPDTMILLEKVPEFAGPKQMPAAAPAAAVPNAPPRATVAPSPAPKTVQEP